MRAGRSSIVVSRDSPAQATVSWTVRMEWTVETVTGADTRTSQDNGAFHGGRTPELYARDSAPTRCILQRGATRANRSLRRRPAARAEDVRTSGMRADAAPGSGEQRPRISAARHLLGGSNEIASFSRFNAGVSASSSGCAQTSGRRPAVPAHLQLPMDPFASDRQTAAGRRRSRLRHPELRDHREEVRVIRSRSSRSALSSHSPPSHSTRTGTRSTAPPRRDTTFR